MWVSQLIGIATPGGIRQIRPQWRHHLHERHATLERLQPVPGCLRGIVLGFQPGDHTSMGGDLDALTGLNPFQVSGQMLAQVSTDTCAKTCSGPV